MLVGVPAQLVDPSEAKDALRSGPDLSVNAEIVYLGDQGRSMVVPGPFQPSVHLRQIMSQPGAAASPEFLGEVRSAGGVSLTLLTLRMVVEGRRNQEIRILDIRPKIVERTPPLDGTLFDAPGQGAGPTMKMLLDLDRAHPIVTEAVITDDEVKSGPAFFGNTTISLKDREEQVIILRALAVNHYAAFELIFEYRLGDKARTMTLTNQGQAFRVTGPRLGAGPDELSYQDAFELQGDFSLCRIAEPRRFSRRSGNRCV
jgi:hypothetical protein